MRHSSDDTTTGATRSHGSSPPESSTQPCPLHCQWLWRKEGTALTSAGPRGSQVVDASQHSPYSRLLLCCDAQHTHGCLQLCKRCARLLLLLRLQGERGDIWGTQKDGDVQLGRQEGTMRGHRKRHGTTGASLHGEPGASDTEYHNSAQICGTSGARGLAVPSTLQQPTCAAPDWHWSSLMKIEY